MAMANADLDNLNVLLRLLEYQAFIGCGNMACDKSSCYTYRSRVSPTPFRGPSRMAARNQALVLVNSFANAKLFVCDSLRNRPHEALPALCPEELDPNSFQQALVSSSLVDKLFEDYERGNDQVTSRHNRHSLPNQPRNRRLRQAVWPLPHARHTGRVWMSIIYCKRQQGDRTDLSQSARSILHPPGYETPSPTYECRVIRAISLFKMQEVVKSADFHYDMIVRPQGYFLDRYIGSIPLGERAVDLGGTEEPSSLGEALVLPLNTSFSRRFSSMECI